MKRKIRMSKITEQIDFESEDDEYIKDLASVCRNLYLGEQIDDKHIKQSKMKAAISGDEWAENMINAEIEYRKSKPKYNINKEERTNE